VTEDLANKLKREHPTYYRLMQIAVGCFFSGVGAFAIAMIGALAGSQPLQVVGLILLGCSVGVGVICLILMIPLAVVSLFKRWG
jgi:hypothetical protein